MAEEDYKLSLEEYGRIFDMIIQAVNAGFMTKEVAFDKLCALNKQYKNDTKEGE